MTSGKYYTRWFREAGRGHLVAVISWGMFFLCLLSTLIQLRIDTEYTFWGIGNNPKLLWGCAGLGLLVAFIEFCYLLQVKKQDFYYSLPVKKSTIFWSRYLHGISHSLVAMILYMGICGIYESAVDGGFAEYAAEYVGWSILTYGAVFLLFYHIGMFAVVICGKTGTALLTVIVIIEYFDIMIRGICLGYVKEFYETFYRIPVLEQLAILLSPWKLGVNITGNDLYRKQEVLAYHPGFGEVFAIIIWIGVLLMVTALVQRTRKTEMTGKEFVQEKIERVAEILLSVLAGLMMGRLLQEIFKVNEWGTIFAGCMMGVTGIIVAAMIHCLLEWLIQLPTGKVLRRWRQMVLEGALVFVAVFTIMGLKPSFDNFLPAGDEVEALSLRMNGVDMEWREYMLGCREQEDYTLNEDLKCYTFSEDAKVAGMNWIQMLRSGPEKEKLTTVTVCYRMKSGSEKYRIYPVDENSFTEYASVYESREYKSKAYPLINMKNVEEDKITWSDGVKDQVLKLSAEEKRKLLEAYKEDAETFEMCQLKTALPIGSIILESEEWGVRTEAFIYPFFENTCSLLDGYGVAVGKEILDYPVESIKMQVTKSMGNVPGQYLSGGVHMEFYKEEEEILQWRGRLIPQEYAVQPLLYPVDVSVDAEVKIEDTESNSMMSVECYEIEKGMAKPASH